MKTKHGLPLFIFAILLTSCGKDPIGSTDGTFKDSRDNHLYKYVKIGTQTWMAENLAYLPAVNPSEDGSYNEPYYYVYDFQGNDVAKAKEALNFQTYGCLYNWVAAVNACPQGWHLPTDKEWMILEIYLGMSQADAESYWFRYSGAVGRAMKSTSGWDENGNGDNSSFFDALPGSRRYASGIFMSLGSHTLFWTGSEDQDSTAWSRLLYFGESGVARNPWYKVQGFSVRCLRN